MVKFIELYNFALLILFATCYLYQAVYVVVGLFQKERKRPENPKQHRFAVLISARNERAVIGGLLDSIRAQHYPAELVDMYVIADNCTDDTAEIAEAHGARVFRRFNQVKVGKGYALDYAFGLIAKEKGLRYYDGYMIFDADNVLDRNYIAEMNKTFSLGYPVVTSYRNSKNYDSSWVSASYALWFLRESRFLNGARMKLGTSCAISGTGFLVSSETIEKDGGWRYSLLTEDIEFSTDHIIRGDKIGYCSTAVLYDEQPVTLQASWNQRMRWTKGFYQVFWNYGKGLINGCVKHHSFQCYDMLMTLAPGNLLTLASLILNTLFMILGAATSQSIMIAAACDGMVGCLINVYISLLFFGVITLITERKQIHCPLHKRILYLFAFPVFIFTYIPMTVAALVKDVTWKPVSHTIIRSVDQICEQGSKKA